MSHQPVADSITQVDKAGQSHHEERDTTAPDVVLELLMCVLRANGKSVQVSGIWKNTRDDILWSDGNKLPWRRTAIWLLLRVSLQLTLERLSSALYKRFQIFMMAHILAAAVKQEFDSEFLHCMNSKLAQRLRKMDLQTHEDWMAFVSRTMIAATHRCEGRWKTICERNARHLCLTNLTNIPAGGDTYFTGQRTYSAGEDLYFNIPGLDTYLQVFTERQRPTTSAKFNPASRILDASSEHLPCINHLSFQDPLLVYNLTAFEDWVEIYLATWLQDRLRNIKTCSKLCNAIRAYYVRASCEYEGLPEALSMMTLTILELWVACDKSATVIHPALRDYDTEVPLDLLGCLLLRLDKDLRRLSRVEEYVDERRKSAKPEVYPSVFISVGGRHAFSVRYFSDSDRLKALKEKIEEDAQVLRKAKVSELERLKVEYSRLMRNYEAGTCQIITYEDQDGHEAKRHHPQCLRCAFRKEAHDLSIEVHEWPLPRADLTARSVVFELDPPPAFSSWRDSTFFLINKVLVCFPSLQAQPQAKYSLHSFSGLHEYIAEAITSQRVTLLSEVKPHRSTHRRYKCVADTTKEDVCVNHGPVWKYYSSELQIFLDKFGNDDGFSKLCTFKLPDYTSSMQKFMHRPSSRPSGEDPNLVIALQYSCPAHFALDEFRSLCSSPLGHHIQWQNILINLTMGLIDWKKIESILFVFQFSQQAGPRGEHQVLRPSNKILSNEHFARAMLDGLEGSLQRVKENWDSCLAIGIFEHVAGRLLSLGPEALQSRCLMFLGDCRQTCWKWLQLLCEKASHIADETQRSKFLERVLDIALICVDTFNVDSEFLQLLIKTPNEAMILLRCFFAIQETVFVSLHCNTLQKLLLHRWRQLALRAAPMLTDQITRARSPCLDKAIQVIWPSYNPAANWETSPQAQYWLEGAATNQTQNSQRPVSFSLLTGEFRVDGQLLSRLPRNIEDHPDYEMFFGQFRLDVLPSLEPGLQFTGQKLFAGYTIHLGLSGDTHNRALLLRASKDDHVYDLIPKQLLRDKFPRLFSDEFVHWYSHATGVIEFRPLAQPWDPCSSNWQLSSTSTGRFLKKGVDKLLFNPLSKTVNSLLEVFSPLEKRLGLQVYFNSTTGSVTIDIPRLQLSFQRKRGTHHIVSNQFRGMRVDESQCIETLIGLQSKLVLCNERNPASRLVMIPEGDVSYCPGGSEGDRGTSHVEVTIDQSKSTKVQTYNLEEHLGQLTGNGTLQSKVFLAYLHALTSHCLPDKFTGHTGTESALSILRSEGVRSFSCLDQDNIDILTKVAELSPPRTYYPWYLKTLQVVRWSTRLVATAQHGEFHRIVSSLFRQARETHFFYPGRYIEPPNIDRLDEHLYSRDDIRSSTYRTAEFGAELHVKVFDAEYISRDYGLESDRAERAFKIASLISSERATLHAPVDEAMAELLYALFSGPEELVGPNSPLESGDLQYDCSWLEPASERLPLVWCRLHQALRVGLAGMNKYSVMMCLATVAYAAKSDFHATQVLVAFTTIQSLQNIDIPQRASFNLSVGHTCSLSTINTILRSHAYTLGQCPEAQLPRQIGESARAAGKRRHDLHRNNRDQCIAMFSEQFFIQWPNRTPTLPQDPLFATYVDVRRSIRSLHQRFEQWHMNGQFLAYLNLIYAEMGKIPVQPIFISPSPSIRSLSIRQNQGRFVSSNDIFNIFLPQSCQSFVPHVEMEQSVISPVTMAEPRLSFLLDRLSIGANSEQEAQYFDNLKDSTSYLHNQVAKYKLTRNADRLKQLLFLHQLSARSYVEKAYRAIFQAVHKDERAAQLRDTTLTSLSMVAVTYQWPRISKRFFLRQLNRHNWQRLPLEWKKAIVTWCIGLTQLHRAERLVKSAGNEADIVRELRNKGHENWDPLQFPDSLLLEVESGIMIRDVQDQIAREMKSPPGNTNTVMQLNMGEGKSSVIVPIVASSLADSTKLVRIICAKPQSKQMFDMLVSKLGGLIGRQVFHMPFTRALKIGRKEAKIIAKLYHECMLRGGVLLVQPEHILSFQLMGIECFINGNEGLGRELQKTQNFFNEKTRDIVDESDENLSVKFELVYTMGQQRPIEHGPDRWVLVQEILGLIAHYSAEIQRTRRHSVELCDQDRSRFPRVRLLHPEAVARLIRLLATHICETGITGLPISRHPQEIRVLVSKYISEPDLSAAEISAVEDSEFWNASTSTNVLLVRGLLAGGIIGYVLGEKRWRVNYGLDPTRKPRTGLAVPYLAKDCPTARSEFSHPDVVIVLTCLSYYYGGLNDIEMFLSFNHLLQADQADVEYQLWVKFAPTLPPAFGQLEGINIKDHEQCITQVFPHMRYSKGTIDYFLANIVFAKEMREFPHKLSASGWDIAKTKCHPTTGFSGTNDSRHVLPLNMKQLDLSSQKHTNALVMEYLLQPENSVIMMPSLGQGVTSIGNAFLEMVTKMQPETRVILDVGAHIIELSNLEVARHWLVLSAEQGQIQAAVFCDEKDQVSVINRHGQIELLQTSPYAKQPDSCLVFLDEAHTRGIDLRLPPQYRAAVTLGASLTKDRLVQGRNQPLLSWCSSIFSVAN